MGMVMIKCPKTARAIPTGIEMTRTRFNRSPVFFSRTFCPTCQTHHEWFAQEAWVREHDAEETTALSPESHNQGCSSGW
jgi:hypothetical protein